MHCANAEHTGIPPSAVIRINFPEYVVEVRLLMVCLMAGRDTREEEALLQREKELEGSRRIGHGEGVRGLNGGGVDGTQDPIPHAVRCGVLLIYGSCPRERAEV